MIVKKLNTEKELQRYAYCFNQKIKDYDIPWEYFKNGDVWALFDQYGRIVGGFALIYEEQRVIRELPIDSLRSQQWLFKRCVEITGYFINQKKGSFKLTLKLLYAVFFASRKYFIYAYPTLDKSLQKYYGHGSPILVYSGIPEEIEGHPKNKTPEPQNVEILTRYGILKIFLVRSFKHFFRKRTVK